jgi:pimeloyl-ACP methyl ester carboxylesterase
MPTFRASDGILLSYLVDDFTDPWKPAETLVLLHAAMGSARRFYAWVPHLARDFRVVRLDLRGHGASEAPGPGQLSLDRLTRDVIDLIDHVGVERVHLAGSSAGAIIALAAAIMYPERLHSLGVFATTPGLKRSNVNAEQWVKKIREKGVRGFLAETITDRFDLRKVEPAFVEWFLDESGKADPDVVALVIRWMTSVDLTDRIASIRCPTLAVVPDHDPIGSISQYDVLRERIPQCEFIVYEGLPHNITDAAPDRCAEELHRFLLKHRAVR